MKFIFLALFLISRFVATSEGAELLWTRIHPHVDLAGFSDITSSEQGLLAIGVANVITYVDSRGLYFSKDGKNWIRGETPNRVWWSGIAGSGDGFVAVGDGGAIVFSKHGYAWEAVASGVTSHLRSVVWTGASFIACGDGGRILRSVDGKTWQNQVSGVTTAFQNVFLAGGKVHAVGGSTFASSVDDGFGWTTQNLGTDVYLMRGCARPNGVLLYSEYGSARWFFRDNDLGAWEKIAVPGARSLTALGFHEEKGFLAVNDRGDLLFSADGVAWSTSAENLSGAAGALTTIEDGWIVAGAMGQILRVGRGRGWKVPVHLNAAAHAVAWHAGRYYAFGHYRWIHSSTDGLNWSSSYGSSSADVLRSCVSFNDQLIIVGARGAAWRINSTGVVSSGTVGTTSVDLRAVASSGSRLVAVGMAGVIYLSDDGQTWASVPKPVTTDLHAIVHTNGRFHAVGKSGLIIESLDGVTWTVGTVGTAATLFGIAATDGGLAVVGSGGAILRKPAGGTWQSEQSGTAFNLHAVIESADRLLVCGDAGTLLGSVDDGIWTSERTGSPAGCDLRAALITDGRLMLVGGSGFYEESINLSSSLGWVVAEFPGGGVEVIRRPYSGFEAVAAVPDGFLAAGWNGRTMLSPDGEHWSEGSFPEKWTIRDLSVANGLIIAGGDQGIMVSTEGRNWIPATYEKYGLNAYNYLSPAKQVRRVARGASDWLAVGSSGTVLRSFDGLSWHRPLDTSKVLGSSTLTGAAYGAGRWVISGETGKVRVSNDGEQWVVVQTPTTQTILDVCHLGGRFVASISDAPDVMLESTDGMTWVLSPGISGWRAAVLRLADGRCFGLGPRERIASTADGSSWISHSEGTKIGSEDSDRPEMRGIAFKDGIYVAVGTRGIIARSENRDSWTHVVGGGVRGFRRVSWMRDRFVALAAPGNLLSSVDGRSWTNHRTGNHPHELLSAVVDNGSRAVAVGKTVLVSDDLVSWVETGVPSGKEFTSVAWDGTRFIAGSFDGGIYQSSDGTSWSLEFVGPLRINDVAGIDGMALALSGSTIRSCANAGPWVQVTNTWGNVPSRFLYADGARFMVTGGSGSLWSADGQSWERLSMTLGRVAKGAQGYFALSPDSPYYNSVDRLFQSQDGRQWSMLPVSLPGLGVNVIERAGALLTFHEYGEVMLGVPLVSAAFQTEMLASGYPYHLDLSPSADANGDGIPNMVAHYFGLNIVDPNPGGIAALPKLELVGTEEGVISVEIPTPGNPASYLRSAIEAGESLDDWEEVAVRRGAGPWTALPGGAISPNGDGSILLELPAHSHSRFFRIKIEEQP